LANLPWLNILQCLVCLVSFILFLVFVDHCKNIITEEVPKIKNFYVVFSSNTQVSMYVDVVIRVLSRLTFTSV